MTYCARHHDPMRLAQMATRVFGCQMDYENPLSTAMDGIQAFRTFLKSIGMPLTFQQIGADPAGIDELVELCHIGNGRTGGFVALDKTAHSKFMRWCGTEK